MNVKEKAALDKLVTVYTELYPSRSVFKPNLFPYAPDEVERIIEGLFSAKDKEKSTPRTVSEEIKAIVTADMVRDFISKLDLLSGQFSSLDENELAKEISLGEYKHLYSVLYSTPLPQKTKKEVVIRHIVEYFDSVERTKSLKT